jgi:hypothetical protein
MHKVSFSPPSLNNIKKIKRKNHAMKNNSWPNNNMLILVAGEA